MPVRTIVSLWPLFFGLSLVGMAIGVQGSLLGFRAEMEGFRSSLIGLIMSAYYAGFLVGAVFAPSLIISVGHIRTFGAVTALASITILVHASFVEPWTWVALRFLTGFAFSSIFVVSESWLNQAANNQNRGQILSYYMIIQLAGTTVGQFMLSLADPGGFALFILISVMVSFAAIPILMKVMVTPPPEETDRVSIAHLWRRAPMGVMGIVVAQWCIAIVFGMGAVYAAMTGMNVQQVAWFMGAIMSGAMILQWPLGKLSDIFDRRWVIGFSAFFGAVFAFLASQDQHPGPWLYTCCFMFGGFCLSQYSIVVAVMHDHLRPSEIIPASGTIVLLSGIVAIFGPLGVALAIEVWGLVSYFLMIAGGLLLLAVISIWRVLTIPALPAEYKTHANIQAAATPVGSVLHPEEKEAH